VPFALHVSLLRQGLPPRCERALRATGMKLAILEVASDVVFWD
jgi:hypothetical protein